MDGNSSQMIAEFTDPTNNRKDFRLEAKKQDQLWVRLRLHPWLFDKDQDLRTLEVLLRLL
jgi:hypothetical protein